jgi:hypothetical protein
VLIEEIVLKVRENLNLTESTNDLIIRDTVQEVLNYCNLTECPIELEPFIRKKVRTIINYESENGTTSVFDVKSIREGDTSITYNVDENTSKETVYGLSKEDKKRLQSFRRVRR